MNYESRTSDLSASDDEGAMTADEGPHPSLSPKSSAESLFFGELPTSNISANALAQQIRMNHKEGISGVMSTITDDFASAVESAADLDDDSPLGMMRDDPGFALPSPKSSVKERQDKLTDFSSHTDYKKEANTDTNTNQNSNMTKAATVKPIVNPIKDALPPKTADSYVQVFGAPKGTKVKKDAPLTPARNTPPPEHANAASHVYEHAKGIWAWGKGVGVFSPFLGLAEGIASKAVGVVGTNLEEIDGTIKPQLSNLDNGLLNPIIGKVAGIALGAVVKTEDIFKPIIIMLLNPLGMIEDDKSDTPELTAVTSK